MALHRSFIAKLVRYLLMMKLEADRTAPKKIKVLEWFWLRKVVIRLQVVALMLVVEIGD